MVIIYLLIFLILAAVISVVAWMYIFSIYEIQYTSVETKLTNGSFELKIISRPVNSFGFKSPCRKLNYSVNVKSGKKNIKNIKQCGNQIVIVLFKSADEEIIIDIKSNLDLFPYQIRIN